MPRIPFVLDERDVRFEAVRAQGAGGQNVNKVSNAVVLRFDIDASSLPAALKARLRARSDQRIGSDGVVTIKAQEHRSLPRNRAAALARLRALIDAAATLPRKRIATAPTRASRERRLSDKVHKGRLKATRGSRRDE
ncbi:MAG TPA: alternative ribosome rescue aminoacyl-tRNA hydrolase ArfB [Burkholderiaceae bacterium]|nr:alternative ribosome rescue aminoacyl-tRNA hydrolase ArfB [Burkholderiaceae bacterium]